MPILILTRYAHHQQHVMSLCSVHGMGMVCGPRDSRTLCCLRFTLVLAPHDGIERCMLHHQVTSSVLGPLCLSKRGGSSGTGSKDGEKRRGEAGNRRRRTRGRRGGSRREGRGRGRGRSRRRGTADNRDDERDRGRDRTRRGIAEIIVYVVPCWTIKELKAPTATGRLCLGQASPQLSRASTYRVVWYWPYPTQFLER